jgi:indolepyruvate ferredoxin oxidoreductase alpha subunit
MKELLMGNEAIAIGALAAGTGVFCGYPGTPSSEVLETAAKRRPEGVYVEWSVNEKTALEVAVGAAYTGSRVLVTMKQVGLNVASDPLMCVNYIGIKGGMVILVADDPGPISSQTEQDTRAFGKYARIPIFDPVTPEDAYEMIQDAFFLSEKIGTPVIFRPTTRICHSCAVIDVGEIKPHEENGTFIKDSRWVIFPRLAHEAKRKLFLREKDLAKDLSAYPFNEINGEGSIGVAMGGISAAYTQDALAQLDISCKTLTITTPYPFPEPLALNFLEGLDRVIVFEELDPVIEEALIYLCGKHHLDIEIYGKHSGQTIIAGENSENIIAEQLSSFFGLDKPAPPLLDEDTPALAVRPPILCAGCPHRASFYAVKQAMKGQNTVFSGDIGCYTLGNAAPLDMTDTCLCMGAGISIPQGLARGGDNAVHFGFVGDSTFFHSGITNVINAVYNQTDEIICILDNSTTAMTGHQPHPGIGKTLMGDITEKISIEKLLAACNVESVRVVNPLDFENAVKAVKDAATENGVRCIIFRAPCIALFKAQAKAAINGCKKCKKCIKELGCPALSLSDGIAVVNEDLCNGCMLCATVCPHDCIKEVER